MTLALLNNNAGANATDSIAFRLNANVLKEKNLSSNFEDFEHKHSFPSFENFKEFCFCLKNPTKMKYLLGLYAFIYSDFKENYRSLKVTNRAYLTAKMAGI